MLSILSLACLIDWAIDRDQDTPWGLRLALFVIQALVAGATAWYFLVRPLLGSRLSNNELALLVEDKNPDLEHRLISAVQLNQPRALTEGMSPELIAQVTREAEQQAGRIAFARLADNRRLAWSAAVAGPVLALVLIVGLLWPGLVLTLIARQFLLERDVPRSITLVSETKEVWPLGEKVTLRFHITGKDLDTEEGEVLVQPEDLPQDRYALELEERTGPDEAVYVARVQTTTADFTYSAWMGDGRTRRPLQVRFVPRPVVEELTAWLLLPPFCDPEGGQRYQQPQARGDIVGIRGSQGRVVVRIQKPITTAFMELLSSPEAEPGNSAEAAAPEIVQRKVDMKLDETGQLAEGTFDLRAAETAYRVVLADEYGFENVPPPRRALRLIAEDPPQVGFLPEVLPPASRFLIKDFVEDFDVEGMPVLLGGAIPIAYTCSGPYGLGHAQLLFRVLKKAESGNEEVPEEKWQILPLAEVKGSKDTGTFDLLQGMFVNSGPRDQVQFHAIPSREPTKLGRTLGGGRFDFKTTGIPDGKGGYRSLREGDQIEYCIEVFADRDPNAGRPSARSESRVKTMVSLAELERWIGDNVQEVRRIRILNDKQTGVFEKKQ